MQPPLANNNMFHAPMMATMRKPRHIRDQERQLKYANVPQDLGSPLNTLYVRNLNERVKLQELRRYLFRYFSKFGVVDEVKVWGNIRMRGQAFIVFTDELAACKALEKMQKFPLFGQPMIIMFARQPTLSTMLKANETSTGSISQEYLTAIQKHREQAESRNATMRQLRQKVVENSRMRLRELYPHGQQPVDPYSQMFPPQSLVLDEFLPPNKILFVQNVPATVSHDQLTAPFQSFFGFRELRQVPSRPDIAFVEYSSDFDTIPVREALDGCDISKCGDLIKVSFARK